MTYQEFLNKQEDEFNKAVEILSEAGYYSTDMERTTLDREWTESELQGCLEDDILDVYKDNLGIFDNRVLIDENLKYSQYMIEQLKVEYDVIELYNKLYDKHKDDTEKLFPIAHFDNFIKDEVLKRVKKNLVTN